MLRLKMYAKAVPEEEKPEEVYKVTVLGREPVEISARSPEEAIEKADIPSDWVVMKSGRVITAHPRVCGG